MTGKEGIIGSVADAEVRVLQALWEESPLGSQQIIARLAPHGDIKPQTIKTFINRLLTKGAIGYREHKRRYLYFPLISKADFYRLKTDRFLDRFYDGQLSPLISFFSHHGKLSEDDLAELKALIEQAESDHGD